MSSQADLVGAVLDGRYRVIEAVAEGAMGVVYRAERLKLGRIVAVKVLHDELPKEIAAAERFEREAMAMAKLEHPHCAAVLDVGTHDGRPFVVMDFVSGHDLKHLIEQGPVPVARAIELVRQVLSGLAHAHELGIIHRDIKPANIMLGHKAGLGDHVKILDFGLARLQQEQTSRLTTGIVVGTPAYMAPEQIRGTAIDARADLYACAVMLAELVTGQKPFHSHKDDPLEVVQMHLKLAPPRLSDLLPGVEFGPLEVVIAKALAKSPADRYQTAGELVAALAAIDAAHIGVAGAAPRATPGAAEPSMAISPSMMIPAGETRLGLATVPSDPSMAVSPSMMIPQGGTRLGLPVAPVAAEPPASAGAGDGRGPASAVTGTTQPLSFGAAVIDDVRRAVPEPSGPAPGAATVGGHAPGPWTGGAGSPAPAGSPGGPVPGAASPTPAAASTPRDTAPLRSSSTASRGLPFSRRQIAIALCALVAILVVVVVASGGGGRSGRSITGGEIEMGAERVGGVETVLGRVKQLAASGDTDAAIDALVKARKRFGDDARLPYEAGKLYFAKLWWTDGIASFRTAIAIDPAMAGDPTLIKTVLKGYLTTPSVNRELAEFLREDLGEHATPYLDETARDHPSADKRARAQAWLDGR